MCLIEKPKVKKRGARPQQNKGGEITEDPESGLKKSEDKNKLRVEFLEQQELDEIIDREGSEKK